MGGNLGDAGTHDQADDVGAQVGDTGLHDSAGAKADIGATLGGDGPSGSGQEMVLARTMDLAVGDAGVVGVATHMTPSSLPKQLRSTLPTFNQSGECSFKTTFYPVTDHRLTGNL